MSYTPPDPSTEDLLDFFREEWLIQQGSIDSLVKIVKGQRLKIRELHDEIAWIEEALRDHFPHWFDSGVEEDDDE